MNPEIQNLYADYLVLTGESTAAASLALAHVMRESSALRACRPDSAAEIAPDRAFSVAEAALRLHVSEKTVYELCQKKQLGHHRVGRAIRILPADIEAYQQDAKPKPAPGRFARLKI